MLPIIQRTWAPRGQTPVLEHVGKRRHHVSAIGMLTVSPKRRRIGCYHLLQPNQPIDEAVVVAVLKQMRRHFRCPLIILWDRLQVHRSAYVRKYVGRVPSLHVESFPAYAPELNPVEYLWGDTKLHDMAQFCPHDLDELQSTTAEALAGKRHDQQRLAGYIRQSGLPIRLRIPRQ